MNPIILRLPQDLSFLGLTLECLLACPKKKGHRLGASGIKKWTILVTWSENVKICSPKI